HIMIKFEKEQKVYSIGGVTIGGQPGQSPTVLAGSIFFGKHKIVSDPARGIFDEKKARDQLELEAQASAATANPRFIDPIGDTAEALIKYITFLADATSSPILVDSPYPEARMEALRHFAGTPLISRLIYNSIAEDLTEPELACIRECGVKSAVILAFSTRAMLPLQRIALLKDKLLPAAERAGIENILVDTGVLDVPSISWAAQTIYEVKKEFGYPAGCAPANSLFNWQKLRLQGDAAFQAAASSIYAMTKFMGADFILYGPMRFAPWIYPAIAAVDAMLGYGGRFNGIRPAGKEHPLYKIF
ncbi:MAG: tetrahydromethanopterin S-methyltransferase subunit H, partial [Pseudomonadota bacterium]